MKKLKGMLPYIIVLLIDFYLLPLPMRDTGTAMLLLLVAIPLICLICSVIYGIKQGFYWLYPTMAAVLFTPTIWMYYNTSAWVYIVAYAVIAVIGNLIGMLFYKQKKE